MTADYPDITFSVKMRLGITDPDAVSDTNLTLPTILRV